ncbi:MAG: SpoIIE family protein phosphatase [Microscillaceae bacterium]|nr:SpoIIE family protein phosphatase [Microscillaceae bacterium]
MRQTYIRNAFIVFSGMILLAAFVFFRLYRQKTYINRRLAQQNEAIQQQSERIMEHQQEMERVNKMLILQNYEITLKNEAIENQNQDIKDSIEYAQRIQSAMLPSAEKLQKILPDHFILFKPKDIVSGDFYWIHQEADQVLVAVVDCTGHGVPGAFMSLIGNELLNDIIIQRKIFSPEKVLDELHQRVRFALNQGETQNKDGMDLALCRIDYQKKELLFAGAYNPVMVVQGGQLRIIAGDNNPIGGWHSQGVSRQFKNKTIPLEEETLVYLYSDGYQDQFGGPQGRKLMKSRFRKLIESIHKEPMPLQHRVLEKTIGNWMQGHAQVDDILVMGIRIQTD